MECVENLDTTDSRTFPGDVCSFRDLIGDCSMVAMHPVCTQAYSSRLHGDFHHSSAISIRCVDFL